MNKVTIKDLDFSGKRVIMRVDFNVPLSDDGRVSDDARIAAALPTINYILKNNPAKLILMSHLGRPKGKVVDSLRMDPVAKRLSESKTHKDKVSPQFDELHDDDITEILLKNENVPLRALLYHFIEEEDYNASKLLLDYNLFLENTKKGNLLTLACSKKEVPVDIIKKLIQNNI